MNRSRKVIDFPTDKNSDGSLKLFAMLFYLFLAIMLIFIGQLSEGGLGILFVMALLYNFGIKQKHETIRYLQKNRIVLLILLGICLLVYLKMTVASALLVGMYWLLVGRNGREAPYFLKFHLLTALIFNFLLLMPYLILDAVIALVSRCLLLLHVGAAATVVASISSHYLPLMMMGLLCGAAIWLSISVLMGRTPYIGVVTNNVRHLA